MATELIPLKPNQHTVTFVPKTTTDLPFFNLTYNKHNTPTEIKYEGKDEAGNPIHWEVFHNTSERIGYAGVLAHEVWYLLIKPAIDASRKADGTIPQIIQLGGIREALRMIGWTAGGHEAKELIKVLSQISFAGCVADLWFPTGETDEEGKQKYLQVKGRFSRLSVYAIGEQHLTQEELEQAAFDFDLEDKLYIQLNPLEVRLQQLQSEQQRLIDNEYMFSVKPIARRWYELLAGKVYGTVKHNAPFFEINYSWYLKHHHNLKRYYERYRVVQQMNRVVEDHLATGFLKKVEYRKTVNEGKEIDFIIRYFTGDTALDSINKIKGYLLNKERKKRETPLPVKKANIIPEIVREAKKRTQLPFLENNAEEAANLSPDAVSDEETKTNLPDTMTAEHRQAFQKLHVEYQITHEKAVALVTNHLPETLRQLEAFPFREIEAKNKAGFLIQAIEQKYSLPDAYLERLEREAAKKAKEEYEEQIRLESEAFLAEQERLISGCSFCDEKGHRTIKMRDNPTYQAFHSCTHDEDIESELEDYFPKKRNH